MITQEQVEGPESVRAMFGENWHRYSDEELAEIQAIDLAAVSPCVLAICTFVVDVLLFIMQLIGIRIMRTNQMVQTAVRELGAAANGLTNIITAIGSNISNAAKAVQIFNLIQQVFNIGALKGIVKGLVSGFTWWGAVIAALAFIAQVIAWIASDGLLLIAQIVLAVVALAAIVADAVAVGTKCSQVAPATTG